MKVLRVCVCVCVRKNITSEDHKNTTQVINNQQTQPASVYGYTQTRAKALHQYEWSTGHRMCAELGRKRK